jgi:hypothetical protein
MRRSLKSVLLAVALAAVSGACTLGAQPAPDAAKVLRDSASAMAGLKTANANLKLTKGTITIEGFSLVSAKTSVRLPTDSDTIYTVKQEDVSFGLEVVMVGGHTYLHIPFSPMTEISGAQAAEFPNMAKLFDPATGLPAVIPQGKDPKYVSTEQVAGTDCYQISTSYTAEQVRSMVSALNSNGPVAARVWAGTSDHYIRKATLEGAFGDNGGDASVEVDISNFNGSVTITSPPPTP